MDISETIHLLGEHLGHVISEQESPALFEAEERIRGLAKARRAGDGACRAAFVSINRFAWGVLTLVLLDPYLFKLG